MQDVANLVAYMENSQDCLDAVDAVIVCSESAVRTCLKAEILERSDCIGEGDEFSVRSEN